MKFLFAFVLGISFFVTSCTPTQQIYSPYDTPDKVAPQISSGEKMLDSAFKNQLADSVEMQMDVIATNLFVPWGMVFTSPQRLLITERNGAVRAVIEGKLQASPLLVFDDFYGRGEAGLLDIVAHPEYETNKMLYVSVVTENAAGPTLRIERLRDEGERLVREKVIMDAIPTGQYHAGSRLVFDDSGYLLVSTGDGTTAGSAQDDESLAGKILRMTDDGALPEGQTSFVMMKGFRNPQGLAMLDSETFFVTEHGPSGFDGTQGGDEFNIGKMGDNFGWPLVSHDKQREGMVSPAKVYTPAVAPASATLYQGQMFPEWTGNVFVGFLKGEGLARVILDQTDDTYKVIDVEQLPDIKVGRIRTVKVAPDGSIYFVTSNRDGRGTVRAGDDTLYRISRKTGE